MADRSAAGRAGRTGMRGAARSPASIRAPRRGDGAAMHRLACAAGELEPNTRYAYLLVARDFAATSAVAERDGGIVGFVSCYPRPGAAEPTLFLWQVGVAPGARGEGIARRMVLDILRRAHEPAPRWLETTVSPSNAASRRLFAAVARDLGTGIEEGRGFAAAEFEEEAHEDEPLLRIGPLEGAEQVHSRAPRRGREEIAGNGSAAAGGTSPRRAGSRETNGESWT